MTQQLQQIIDSAWENRASISAASAPKEVVDAVEHVIAELDAGRMRVATREGVGQWTVHQWLKKAVLLSFRLKDNALIQSGALNFSTRFPPSTKVCRKPKSPPPACVWCPLPSPAAAPSSPRARS